MKIFVRTVDKTLELEQDSGYLPTSHGPYYISAKSGPAIGVIVPGDLRMKGAQELTLKIEHKGIFTVRRLNEQVICELLLN